LARNNQFSAKAKARFEPALRGVMKARSERTNTESEEENALLKNQPAEAG
jgi:hypothetical protein